MRTAEKCPVTVMLKGFAVHNGSIPMPPLQSPPCKRQISMILASKAIEGLALALEGIDNVQGSDGLAAGMLSVGDSIPDDVLKKHLEHA